MGIEQLFYQLLLNIATLKAVNMLMTVQTMVETGKIMLIKNMLLLIQQ
nr:MAG TPA: hypothetical protein [Caudoviricetes sp.]